MKSLITGIWTKQAVFLRHCHRKVLPKRKVKPEEGKGQKKRLTIAFFVNATGEKAIEPLLVWRNENPRCFKNNESLSRPHGIYYYSNPEAWMTTEIMTSILGKIN